MNTKYTILNPTGNITALVETPVDISGQPDAAARIMASHPEVEQVGFVDFSGKTPSLRMAGGEFCGNASMSAAALYVVRKENFKELCETSEDEEAHVILQVSGASDPVEVSLSEDPDGGFKAKISMPAALGITDTEFSYGDISDRLPVVSMEGISHIVIEPSSPFFDLKKNKAAAEEAVRLFCDTLGAKALGLMFLEPDKGDGSLSPRRRLMLSPLVYVPESGTVFWENSCASGSCAAGEYAAFKTKGPVSLSLEEPGGVLQVQCSEPVAGCVLYGSVRFPAISS